MNIALLGTWHVHTKDYVKTLTADERFCITAVYDPDAQHAAEYADRLQAKAYTDLDALFQDGGFEAVMVCSATCDHDVLMCRAAREGKHIFTEKVLAITPKGAAEIRDAVKENGVKFVISYPHKCRPSLMAAKKLLDSGTFGTLTYARVRNAHDGSTADWLPPHFYDKEQCGGGAMMDLGAHPMYTLLWLLGEPASVVSTFTTVTGRPVEDNAVSVLRYENGLIAVSETAFVSRANGYVVELLGTDGGLRILGDQVEMYSAKAGKTWFEVKLPEPAKSPLAQWMDWLCGGEPATEFGIDEAVRLTSIMDAAYRGDGSGAVYEK